MTTHSHFPDRSNYIHGSDPGVTDIGWCDGYLNDGRPYLGECWAVDGLTQVTLFFSTPATPDLTRKETAVRFLRENGLVQFKPGKEYVWCGQMDDAAGHPVWSVNIAIALEDEVFVQREDLGVLHRYPRPGPPGRRPSFWPLEHATRPGRWKVHLIFIAGWFVVLNLVIMLTDAGRGQEITGLTATAAWVAACYGVLEEVLAPLQIPARSDEPKYAARRPSSA